VRLATQTNSRSGAVRAEDVTPSSRPCSGCEPRGNFAKSILFALSAGAVRREARHQCAATQHSRTLSEISPPTSQLGRMLRAGLPGGFLRGAKLGILLAVALGFPATATGAVDADFDTPHCASPALLPMHHHVVRSRDSPTSFLTILRGAQKVEHRNPTRLNNVLVQGQRG